MPTSPTRLSRLTPALTTLVYERHDLAAALRSGDVKIEGDGSAVARFLALFPLPEPAATAVGHKLARPTGGSRSQASDTPWRTYENVGGLQVDRS